MRGLSRALALLLLVSGLASAQGVPGALAPCKMDGSDCAPATGTVTTTGTLASGQVALGSGATSVTSSDGLTYTGSSTTFRLGIRLLTVTPPTALTVGDTGTTSPRGIMSWQSNTGTDGARLHLRKSRGTFGTPLTVVTGDTLGRLVGSGYDGTSWLEMAGVNFLATGTIGTNRIPTQIQFQTATDAAPSVLTTALTLNSSQQALFADGTAALPAVSFASKPTFGFFADTNGVNWTVSGSTSGRFYNGGLLATVELSIGSAAEVRMSKRATATLQHGAADSATPVAQTIAFQGSRGGTDTNVAGVVATLQMSLGTGSAVPGPFSLRTGYPTASGTTQHVASTRSYTPGAWTTLTETTDTGFATLTFGASSVVGADLLVTIHAADASNNQGMTYRVRVNSVRDAAGNTQSTVGIVDDAGTLPVAAGSGTLTCSFTATEGAAAATVNANCTSSLTQTTLRATFQTISNGPGVSVAQL